MSPEVYTLLHVGRPPRLSVKLLEDERFKAIQGIPAESLKKANITLKRGRPDRFEEAAKSATSFLDVDESVRSEVSEILARGLRERIRVGFTFKSEVGADGTKIYTLVSTNPGKT